MAMLTVLPKKDTDHEVQRGTRIRVDAKVYARGRVATIQSGTDGVLVSFWKTEQK